jgi:hypothetical protein
MRIQLAIVLGLLATGANVHADPCGMVPPIHVDADDPGIARAGAQRTYVMFKDGMETLVLRPGFEGSVDEFGMLIPFPSPPAIRKIDDDTFAHIEGAVEPPELQVIVQNPLKLMREMESMPKMAKMGSVGGAAKEEALRYDEVRVLREEAVGMYQVAVLEAGSSKALNRWMGENGYRYPTGMDDVADEYVAIRWCFVAIKAKVGQAKGVEAAPGMRQTRHDLPPDATFDGHVQGMGFRFRTEKAVIPMRLSVFNGESPRNVVYFLADGPRAILGADTTVVKRQVDGETLFKNVTTPLPVTYPQGGSERLVASEKSQVATAREPGPYNGIARSLFAADMLAARSGELALDFEEEEKKLLNISESFDLRGEEIDALHRQAVEVQQEEAVAGALVDMKDMTLTVIDGVLPHELLRDQNLVFRKYKMPGVENVARNESIRPSPEPIYFWR